MEKEMDACVAQLVRAVHRQSKDPASNPGTVKASFFPHIKFSKELLSVAMKNNMHYSKQYTADSTSVKFAALVIATTLF